jgi:hypothetical protein
VDWFFVLIGLVIFIGPIVWALTAGRKGGAPEKDDARGATAYGSFIARVLTGGRKGG